MISESNMNVNIQSILQMKIQSQPLTFAHHKVMKIVDLVKELEEGKMSKPLMIKRGGKGRSRSMPSSPVIERPHFMNTVRNHKLFNEGIVQENILIKIIQIFIENLIKIEMNSK